MLDELEPTHTDPLLAIADPPPDTHVTAPPLPSDASPPLTHTLPPAPTPAPPSSETLPPDAHCEAVSPALTRTSAPPPADTATVPLVPAAELPLAIDTLPLDALPLEQPLAITTVPLEPSSFASADSSDTEPLGPPQLPQPLWTRMCPPLPALLSPPCKVTLP